MKSPKTDETLGILIFAVDLSTPRKWERCDIVATCGFTCRKTGRMNMFPMHNDTDTGPNRRTKSRKSARELISQKFDANTERYERKNNWHWKSKFNRKPVGEGTGISGIALMRIDRVILNWPRTGSEGTGHKNSKLKPLPEYSCVNTRNKLQHSSLKTLRYVYTGWYERII